MSRELRIYCDVCHRFFHSKPNEKGESVFRRAEEHGWSQNRDHTKAICPSCKNSVYKHLEFENEEDWKSL